MRPNAAIGNRLARTVRCRTFERKRGDLYNEDSQLILCLQNHKRCARSDTNSGTTTCLEGPKLNGNTVSNIKMENPKFSPCSIKIKTMKTDF